MKEFLDVYRLIARNYFRSTSGVAYEEWTKEELDKLECYLEKVGKTIANGDLIVSAWKRELKICGKTTLATAIVNIIDGVIEIENRLDDGFLSQQEFAEETIIPFSNINNEIEKTKEPKYVKSGIPPFKEVLYKYKNATIYKMVYDHLIETLPDKFAFGNIYNTIKNFYIIKPKRKLKHKTLVTYAGRYRDYMLTDKKIKVDRNSGMFVKTLQKEIIETPEKPDIAKPDDAWTAEEDEIITKHYPCMTAPAIKSEKLPHRSEQAIYDRAYYLKIKKVKRRRDEQDQKWQGIFPKDQILAKNNTVYIYKPIVDEIMDNNNLPDKFTKEELKDFLYNYFHKTLKKEIEASSAGVYKSKYARYLIDNNFIEEEVTADGIIYVKIKKKDNEKSRITIRTADDEAEEPVIKEEIEQPAMFADGETLDKAIYNYAVNSGFKSSILTLTVERRFPNYTSDQIEIALAKLIREGKALQPNPGRIKFRIIDV